MGTGGDAGFCFMTLLFAGVDGRDVEATEEAFAEEVLASLTFQDVGCDSGTSRFTGVIGRRRALFSPLRCDRATIDTAVAGAVLV